MENTKKNFYIHPLVFLVCVALTIMIPICYFNHLEKKYNSEVKNYYKGKILELLGKSKRKGLEKTWKFAQKLLDKPDFRYEDYLILKIRMTREEQDKEIDWILKMVKKKLSKERVENWKKDTGFKAKLL